MDLRLNAERQKLLHAKWNYHSLTITTEFYKFYKSYTFTDMSLMCQNRTINCHKLVLYIGSHYFEEQLIKYDGSVHPQFDLAGISFSAMEQVLKFIYKGEIIVGRAEMDEFLETSKKLKVKGLFNETGETNMPPLPAPHPSSSMPSKKGKNYTRTDFMCVHRDVKNGMSVSASARVHDIPSTTISEYLKRSGIRSPFQRPPTGWVNCKNIKYTKEDLAAAVEDVRNGIDGRIAGPARNIPRTTLSDNCIKLGIPFTWGIRIWKRTPRSQRNADFA